MSIATLKRKTQAKYNNMSVGQPQFSINGTHRSQGYVGQTMLSRSLPRTLMKGNTIRGHGGCCGFYPVKPVVQSAVTSLNDSSVVKSSSLGTEGLIATKYRWITRPQPYTSVKPNASNHLNTQQDYITALQKKALQEATLCKPTEKYVYATDKNSGCPVQCYVVKPEKELVATNYGDYYLELDKQCKAEIDVTYVQTRTISQTPFACGL